MKYEYPINAATLEWRPVPGFPGYEASRCGHIRRRGSKYVPHPDGVLSQQVNTYGYRTADMWDGARKRSMRVHRIVAFAFLGDQPTPHHIVAHNDGDRGNNHASNLRWATPWENSQDRNLHDTHYRGERNHNAKLTSGDVAFIRASRLSLRKLADRFGVGLTTISKVRAGDTWSHVDTVEPRAQCVVCGTLSLERIQPGRYHDPDRAARLPRLHERGGEICPGYHLPARLVNVHIATGEIAGERPNFPLDTKDRRRKLSESEVAEIRRRAREGETYKSLGIAFGMDPTTVSGIARGLAWRGASPEATP